MRRMNGRELSKRMSMVSKLLQRVELVAHNTKLVLRSYVTRSVMGDEWLVCWWSHWSDWDGSRSVLSFVQSVSRWLECPTLVSAESV